MESINWLQYPAALFAGTFLTNVVPHFIHGISGNKFPSPFSTPRGIGLSSPTVNVLWALFNLIIGYLLFSYASIDNKHPLQLITFFAGIAAISLLLSVRFQKKHTE